MFKRILPLFIGTLFSSLSYASSPTYVTVEEAKAYQAQQELPEISKQFNLLISDFTKQLQTYQANKQGSQKLTALVISTAEQLWQQAISHLQTKQTFDDRALYWGRLQLATVLRTSPAFHYLNKQEQSELMFQFELASRGNNDVSFTKNTDKKILLTGFDPFFLHRNIAQSNPSGIAAMTFDGMVVEHNGVTAEIQTLMVPVRFSDFDQGMIETMLTPVFKSNDIDMITTVSMGRSDFDLERFPGLRRSSVAPGNLGVYTGANSKNPLIPYLHDKLLTGPEFVEFSLPITAMKQAKGKYKINDNRSVETLEQGKFDATSLAQLDNQTAVQGGGGGYLSNEISYRSILLRDKYQPQLPVGHIHTPRIKEWKKQEVTDIVEQIKTMLTQSISAL
ncbi:hypothetical protein [Thalassomonas sp. M1454]|uniref:hypothetical protein n=1 Tax=Thalassomonas sp. M1454 TaxID=2594477 RepID=UPI00117D49AE|nr:hypothetical protein [Thalassomonas sp. M1454]TRX52342.1 hypothetical protein FNN08_16100 [Thalassomonas sp. M1454]